MTAFAYILAQAPWGPVRVGWAASFAAFEALKLGQPAHVERCEGIDAGQVVETARQALGRSLVEGWHDAKPVEAIARLKEAARAVLARGVAGQAGKATQQALESHGGASESCGVLRNRRAPAHEASAGMSANELSNAHARKARAAPSMTTNDGAGVLPAGTRARRRP